MGNEPLDLGVSAMKSCLLSLVPFLLCDIPSQTYGIFTQQQHPDRKQARTPHTPHSFTTKGSQTLINSIPISGNDRGDCACLSSFLQPASHWLTPGEAGSLTNSSFGSQGKQLFGKTNGKTIKYEIIVKGNMTSSHIF